MSRDDGHRVTPAAYIYGPQYVLPADGSAIRRVVRCELTIETVSCCRPPVFKAIEMCVHEHLSDSLICAECRDLIETVIGKFNCVTCYKADGHICPMTMKFEPYQPTE